MVQNPFKQSNSRSTEVRCRKGPLMMDTLYFVHSGTGMETGYSWITAVKAAVQT